MQLLSNSRMGVLRQCPRKHWFRYELGLARCRTGAPLRMGSAYHTGQETKNNGGSQQDAYKAATVGYVDTPDWVEPRVWKTEGQTVANLLAGYFWRYENEPFQIATWIPPGKTEPELAVELTFKIPLVNPDTNARSRTFWIAGVIDAIVILPDGRVAVLDYKTTGDTIDPDSLFWLKLRTDPQMSLYTLAAVALGFDIACVIYDVTKKPTIKPREIPVLDPENRKIVVDSNGERVFRVNIKKNGDPGAHHGEPIQSASKEKGWTLRTRMESPDEYGQRLIDDIGDRPDYYYARREIPRLDDELATFQAELWQQAATLRDCQRNNRWYRNVGKWTCAFCDYTDLCLNRVGVSPDLPPPSGYEYLDNVHPELDALTDEGV